jgi:hypothetical protein
MGNEGLRQIECNIVTTYIFQLDRGTVAKEGTDAEYRWRYDVKEVKPITIIFVNDKFEEVRYSSEGIHSREEWKIFSIIEAEIARIEKEISNG